MTIELLKLLLFAYVGAALFVAARFGWYMRFEFDAFDWHYKKAIWVKFFFFTLLWPLLAFTPRSLIRPKPLFDHDGWGEVSRKRELDRLRRDPPPCGELIFYRPVLEWGRDICGGFLFQATDIEQIIKDKLNTRPHLSETDYGAILNWICKRSEAIREPTEVPKVWDRFEFVAKTLIQQGKVEVTCPFCNSKLREKDLIIMENMLGTGWYYDQLECPNGHKLIEENDHIYF